MIPDKLPKSNYFAVTPARIKKLQAPVVEIEKTSCLNISYAKSNQELTEKPKFKLVRSKKPREQNLPKFIYDFLDEKTKQESPNRRLKKLTPDFRIKRLQGNFAQSKQTKKVNKSQNALPSISYNHFKNLHQEKSKPEISDLQADISQHISQTPKPKIKLKSRKMPKTFEEFRSQVIRAKNQGKDQESLNDTNSSNLGVSKRIILSSPSRNYAEKIKRVNELVDNLPFKT